MTAQQLTLADLDRAQRVARLRRSLERWRAGDLDRTLPEIYARYCATLAHLESGGAYTVRTFDPAEMLAGDRGAFRPVGEVLAGVSRVTATNRRRYRNA